MKLKILHFFLLISAISFSQTKFEKGYYIDKTDNKHACLIKNIYWKSNPTSFEIKNSENESSNIITIDNIKEIAIDKEFKYVRAQVNIDKSSDNIQTLDNDKNPIFINKLVLLKVLVEGPRNLYSYEDDTISEKFFFRIENSEHFEQLIYKKYYSTDPNNSSLLLNESFKNQLNQFIFCSKEGKDRLTRLNYESSDLAKYFLSVNSCLSDTYNQKEVTKRSDPKLNYKAIASVSNSNIDAILTGNYHGTYQFGTKNNIGFGAEVELLLPINNQTWSLFVQLSYNSYKSSLVLYNPKLIKKTNNADVKISYFQIPLAGRKYFKVTDKSKLFLNLGISFMIVKRGSEISYENGYPMLLDGSRYDLFFGVGFTYKKFSLEINKFANAQLNNYVNNESALFKNLSLNLKYQLF